MNEKEKYKLINIKKSQKKLFNINKKISNKSKKNLIFEDEEENKDLNDILNSDDDISNENKNDIEYQKNKFKKDIDKAILYIVLFLKKNNIQIKNKEILFKLLKNKNFKKGVEYFKSKINKNLEHAKSLGIIYSSKNITDKNIIDYLYKIFMDKTSPYYMIFANSEEYIQNTNWRDIYI